MLHISSKHSNRLQQTLQKVYTSDFTVFRPAGNDTGLVKGIIHNPHLRKTIADSLQQTYNNIEQVGFVNLDPNNPELMMTGGEFCGNATSSAAYHILNGKPGSLLIKVSGVKDKLLAGVSARGEGFSQMPVFNNPSYLKPDADQSGNVLVVMEGITHYIDFNIDRIKNLSVDEIKKMAREEMHIKGIDQNSACGIIYAKKLRNGWVIHPIIYVRDADTLYYESSCGSGTTALGLVHARLAGKTCHEIPVIQPSGKTISVCVEFNGKQFGYVQIQSFVEKIQEGELEIEKHPLGMQLVHATATSPKYHMPQFHLPKFLRRRHKDHSIQTASLPH